MTRKIIIVIAAVLIPGGFLALMGAWLLKAFGQTERGRKVFDLAKSSVPSWVAGWRATPEQRQAA